MEITTNDDGHTYNVKSDSGSNYTVTHRSPAYEEDTHIFRCDCPAAKHGKDCKHVKAVIDFADAYAIKHGL